LFKSFFIGFLNTFVHVLSTAFKLLH
jgi:hypothetical protein